MPDKEPDGAPHSQPEPNHPGAEQSALDVAPPQEHELRRRWVSALVLAPVALAVAGMGGWVFAAFVALAGVLMSLEWVRLFHAHLPKPPLLIIAGASAGAIFIAQSGRYENSFLLLAAAAVGLLIFSVARGHRAVLLTLGVFYVGVPGVLTIWLRNLPDTGQTYFIALLLAVWATDTGAYLMGTAFGGRKLIPQLSPSKTWAGLVGGCAIAGVMAMFIAMMTDIAPVFHLTVLGVVLGLVTQAGDIAESGLKRYVGKKDAGGLIPGHGGVMDRLDGYIFAVTFVALIVWIFKV